MGGRARRAAFVKENSPAAGAAGARARTGGPPPPPVFGQDHPGVVATVAEVGIDGSGRVTNYAVRSVDLETDHPEDADMLRWLSEY
jgi:hypothetical protein